MEKITVYEGVPYPLISINQLQIGSVVSIEGKQCKVSDYDNFFTKKFFEERRRHVFAMVKPDAYPHLGEIIEQIVSAGFYINRLKSFKWNAERAQDFYAEHTARPYFDSLVTVSYTHLTLPTICSV
eukprot:TRINITY_DN1404_c0_g1_i14.p1 TRINITY_DN1404_c0_g1~~TRINITY_DN1404_c0_g1_i14.p1  ORF type:complete len:126 (-),score=27.16 TRINITY_DN1404_c0_g1_i14:45-422(-)